MAFQSSNSLSTARCLAGGRERLAKAIAANPPVRHPVVRTHPESGREALFVNALFVTEILPPAGTVGGAHASGNASGGALASGTGFHASDDLASGALLGALCAHATAPQFTCRFKWRPNSVAFWDNRCTQHRPVNDYWPLHRKLQRVTVDGDRPFFRRPPPREL